MLDKRTKQYLKEFMPKKMRKKEFMQGGGGKELQHALKF